MTRFVFPSLPELITPALSSRPRAGPFPAPDFSKLDASMSDGNYDGQISRPVQSLRGLRAKIADSQDDLDWNEIERVVAKFRKKLTLAQNCRWTDENIEQAFLPLGSDPTYFDGANAQHVYFVTNGIGMSQSCWSGKSQRHCSRPIPGVQDRAEHVKPDYLVYGNKHYPSVGGRNGSGK